MERFVESLRAISHGSDSAGSRCVDFQSVLAFANDELVGLRGWEFCPFSPFFATFSTFTKIPQVPSFQAHSPVITVFRQNPKNARKSQNTPSTNPYQNETQFPLSSLKNATSGHARPPKSVLWPPVISGTNSRQNSLKFP
jgi:hypothetical protein